MNVAFYLMSEFNTPMIPLETIADKYLNMSAASAKRKAQTQELPFPVAKGSSSQKSGLFVYIEDLAKYIQKQRDEAENHWSKMHNPRLKQVS
jgi:hypothetical protein